MPNVTIIATGPAKDLKAARAALDAVLPVLTPEMHNTSAPWSSASGIGKIVVQLPCETEAEAEAARAMIAAVVPAAWAATHDFQIDLAAGARAAWAAQRAADVAAKVEADRTAVEKVYEVLDKAITDEKVRDELKAAIEASTGVAVAEAAEAEVEAVEK